MLITVEVGDVMSTVVEEFSPDTTAKELARRLAPRPPTGLSSPTKAKSWG